MEKIPSGSFSDVEVEDDEGNGNMALEENEARSRNPVRRVNSSPEMSSNWRHPFMNQKTNQNSQNNGTASITVRGVNDDDFADNEQQQKKKNYGKVSCEAIPEEIADSTPPNPSRIGKRESEKEKDQLVAVVASAAVKDHQKDFVAKSNALQSTVSLPATRADSLSPLSQSNALPRKQHSADDAIQQQEQQNQQQLAPMKNEPKLSASGSSINLGPPSSKVKLNIDMPKLTTKPPQSHAPLSPRALARNNFDSSFQKNTNNLGDFPRGRSKTISVVRGEHDSSKWTFKGTKI